MPAESENIGLRCVGDAARKQNANTEIAISRLAVSGHSKLQRLRFAWSLVAGACAMSAISIGKDVYVLRFGADASIVGVILLLCSFFLPMMDSLAGALQDKGVLVARFFPTEAWGRRAPWLLTHVLMLTPVMLVFYIPPSYEADVLHVWFAALWIFGYWCVSVSTNAFEAARVEIYPFKEERVIVEQFCKFTFSLGIGVGTVTGFACLTFPGKTTFILASVVCSVAVLSSIVSTWVLRESRVRACTTEVRINWASMVQMWRSRLVLRMVLLRLLNGVHETILPSLQIYYFQFVFKMDNKEMGLWFVIAGIPLVIAELGLAPLWAFLFSRSTFAMLYTTLALKCVDVVIMPLMLLLSNDRVVFVVYLTLRQICNTSYSYWRVAACAWICDHEGSDREGMYLGFFMTIHNLGRAVASSLVVLGLGFAGLRTVNCLDLAGEEFQACETKQLNDQPASLGTYIKLTCVVGSSLVQAFIIIATFEFPIRPGSKMLDDICAKQIANVDCRSASTALEPVDEDIGNGGVRKVDVLRASGKVKTDAGAEAPNKIFYETSGRFEGEVATTPQHRISREIENVEVGPSPLWLGKQANMEGAASKVECPNWFESVFCSGYPWLTGGCLPLVFEAAHGKE